MNSFIYKPIHIQSNHKKCKFRNTRLSIKKYKQNMLTLCEVTPKVILYLIKLDIILSIIHEYKTLLFNVTAKMLCLFLLLKNSMSLKLMPGGFTVLSYQIYNHRIYVHVQYFTLKCTPEKKILSVKDNIEQDKPI